MPITAEAIEAIQSTAIQSSQPKIQVLKDIRPGVNRYVDSNGKYEDIPQIKPRDEVLSCIADVAKYVEYHTKEHGAKPVVWVSETNVIVILDDSTSSQRRDNAVLEFRETSEFKCLSSLLATSEQLSQKDVINLFRRHLHSAFALDVERQKLISELRAIRFEVDEQSTSGTVRRSMTSQASGVNSAIPNEVELRLNVYDDPDSPYVTIRCYLDVDPDLKAFTVSPIKRDMVDAVRTTIKSLSEIIKSECSCQVFRGHPVH